MQQIREHWLHIARCNDARSGLMIKREREGETRGPFSILPRFLASCTDLVCSAKEVEAGAVVDVSVTTLAQDADEIVQRLTVLDLQQTTRQRII